MCSLGLPLPAPSASAGADDLGIFVLLGSACRALAREWICRGVCAQGDAQGAECCHSCGCHSSPARHLHPKYIQAVAFLKTSMECFPPELQGERSSPGGSWCCSDSCSQGWSCSPSWQHTHTLSSGYLSIISRKQIDPFSYYLIICLFIFSLPGPFWIPL